MSSLHEEGFLSTEINQWIQKHRQANQKWFSLSERCSKLGQQILLSMKIDNENLQQILVALWFNRLLSHFQTIILLMERGMLFEAQIILRTLTEVSFSLVAVAENPALAQDFLKDDKVQQLKSLHTYMNLPKHLRTQDQKQYDSILKEVDPNGWTVLGLI